MAAEGARGRRASRSPTAVRSNAHSPMWSIGMAEPCSRSAGTASSNSADAVSRQWRRRWGRAWTIGPSVVTSVGASGRASAAASHAVMACSSPASPASIAANSSAIACRPVSRSRPARSAVAAQEREGGARGRRRAACALARIRSVCTTTTSMPASSASSRAAAREGAAGSPWVCSWLPSPNRACTRQDSSPCSAATRATRRSTASDAVGIGGEHAAAQHHQRLAEQRGIADGARRRCGRAARPARRRPRRTRRRR